MKTKLAYDVFDKSVERNVAVHTTDATKSAQRYLSESRKLLDVFRSTAPLGKVIDERIGQLQSAGDWLRHGWPSCEDSTRTAKNVQSISSHGRRMKIFVCP